MEAIRTYFQKNQAVLDGQMTGAELACWTGVMHLLGWAMMAVLWVCAR